MGPVEEATERYLTTLTADLAESPISANALAMARAIDSGKGSISECSKRHLEALETLMALAPAKKESDSLDDLAKRRAERLAAGGTKAKALPRT